MGVVVLRHMALPLGDRGEDAVLLTRARGLTSCGSGLDGIDLLAIHGRATSGTLEPLLLRVLARDHAGACAAGRAERLVLVSAGIAEAQAGGSAVGHRSRAIET